MKSITGYGRVVAPSPHSVEVTPDIMTTAKVEPMVPSRWARYCQRTDSEQASCTAPKGRIEFFHGYTYSGHPVAAAAALANAGHSCRDA